MCESKAAGNELSMFQIIEITELYKLERRKPVEAIVAEFGDYAVAPGVTVADYYKTLNFLRTAKKSKRPRPVLPMDLEFA